MSDDTTTTTPTTDANKPAITFTAVPGVEDLSIVSLNAHAARMLAHLIDERHTKYLIEQRSVCVEPVRQVVRRETIRTDGGLTTTERN